MKAFSFKGIGLLLKESFKNFSEDKVPKLGASLAYFTLFSLGPLLLIVIFIAGSLLGQEAIKGSLHDQMQQAVGESAAQQLQEIIKNAATSKQGILAAIIGIITLLLGATSMFGEIQDSINSIWRIKLKPKQSWLLIFKNKLLSFGIVGCISFLFLASLAASAIIEGLGKSFEKLIPGASTVVFYVISQVFTLLIASILFAVIFKILPAAKIRWHDLWPGAITTALLFMIGRFLISLYISRSSLGTTYGVASSLVILLVWIYYSSLIFYFGAEFIKVYAKKFGSVIQPKENAFSVI